MINWFKKRRIAAYRRTFEGPDGRNVLADLCRFCRAAAPSADPTNVYATYMAEGRREVFLRIASHLYVNEKDLQQLTEYHGENPNA